MDNNSNLNDRPLSMLEKKILDYIDARPGKLTAEDILIYFAGYEQDPGASGLRKDVAYAIGYLLPRHLVWDPETGVLTARELKEKEDPE